MTIRQGDVCQGTNGSGSVVSISTHIPVAVFYAGTKYHSTKS